MATHVGLDERAQHSDRLRQAEVTAIGGTRDGACAHLCGGNPITAGVEHDLIRRAAVSAGSSALLVPSRDVLGRGVVYDKPDVRLVHPHPEGDGGKDNSDEARGPLRQEGALVGRREPRMEEADIAAEHRFEEPREATRSRLGVTVDDAAHSVLVGQERCEHLILVARVADR